MLTYRECMELAVEAARSDEGDIHEQESVTLWDMQVERLCRAAYARGARDTREMVFYEVFKPMMRPMEEFLALCRKVENGKS